MTSVSKTQVFNQASLLVEGWYWVLPSQKLKRGKIHSIFLLGREIILYRGENDVVKAMDAYCPHMGAHLKEGHVEGDSIRCFFHAWKFNSDGKCIEIPCQSGTRGISQIRTWSVRERYGLIWFWAGEGEPQCNLPEVPELEGQEVHFRLGRSFKKECLPGVMMVNAIDAQHFNSVHNLPIPLKMEVEGRSTRQIIFKNSTRANGSSWLMRLIGYLYRDRLTYDLSYWFGSTGCVTLGPDFLHFYIMFTLRPNSQGHSEGQTILLTKKRSGLGGLCFNLAMLTLTQIVGNYFARGDTKIFRSIRFDLKNPIRSDEAIVKFIQHVECQKSIPWGLPGEIRTEKSHQLEEEKWH